MDIHGRHKSGDECTSGKPKKAPGFLGKLAVRRGRHLYVVVGGRKAEVLQPVSPRALTETTAGGQLLRDAVRHKDVQLAEQTFAALARSTPENTFNFLLWTVQDNTEVHRVVLP
jgi:hypothetical protein